METPPAVHKTKRKALAEGTYNDNNHASMAPFGSPDGGGTLLVEPATYAAWAQTDELAIAEGLFERVAAQEGPLPAVSEDEWPPWYAALYRAMSARANPQRWLAAVPGASFIAVTKEQAQELVAAALAALDAGAETVTVAWLAAKFQAAMDASAACDSGPLEHGWFVKSGSCSTKHQYAPAPVFSGAEAVDHLLQAFPVLAALKKGIADGFVLRPWCVDIHAGNEVRVFVRQRRVTGVSQQSCYSPEAPSVIHLFPAPAVVEACQRCFTATEAVLLPAHSFRHQCTFDAYLVTDAEGELEARLIEINSGMFGWGPAGASLFQWLDDPPPQPGEAPVVYTVVA